MENVIKEEYLLCFANLQLNLDNCQIYIQLKRFLGGLFLKMPRAVAAKHQEQLIFRVGLNVSKNIV